MNNESSRTTQINQALSARGFKYRGRSKEAWLLYTGELRCQRTSLAVQVAVDTNGQHLPEIQLLRKPDQFKSITPHLSSDGSLCYAAKGSITLDVFDLGGQVLGCLDRATTVLDQLLCGELTEDLGNEFFAYWVGGLCFLDFQANSSSPPRAVAVSTDGVMHDMLAISNTPARTLKKLHAIGVGTSDNWNISVQRVKTSAKPYPTQNQWPPAIVSDVLRWQSQLDANCRRKLEQRLIAAYKDGHKGTLCLIDSPKLKYGFLVKFDQKASSEKSKKPLTTREAVYKAKMIPMSCIHIDDAYLSQRNIPGQRTLAGLKLGVIGCGTIGGYLADLLVKAGAGTDGGHITLVDNDTLMPQNVGRHRLGLNAVTQNKAKALADELTRGSPTAVIQPLAIDALEANFAGVDLLIDATGEEALGHLLAEKFSGKSFLPSLSIWIEGPGTAVRGLLRDSPDAACVRCLKNLSREPLFPAVTGSVPVKLAGHGCESLYVPFPATVSLQAACLATEMVVAWVNGAHEAHLRTRVLDETQTKKTADQSPEKLIGCPACST